jgi:hypothetical protein
MVSVRNLLRRSGFGVALAALVLGTVVGGAGQASAATAGQLKLCSQGDYTSWLRLEASGETEVLAHVPQGQCTIFIVPANQQIVNGQLVDEGWGVDVVGKYNTNNATFDLGIRVFVWHGGTGYDITTGGKTVKPSVSP